MNTVFPIKGKKCYVKYKKAMSITQNDIPAQNAKD